MEKILKMNNILSTLLPCIHFGLFVSINKIKTEKPTRKTNKYGMVFIEVGWVIDQLFLLFVFAVDK